MRLGVVLLLVLTEGCGGLVDEAEDWVEQQLRGDAPARSEPQKAAAPAVSPFSRDMADTAAGTINWQRVEPAPALAQWAGDQGLAFAVEIASAMDGRITLSSWDRGYPERLVLGVAQPQPTRDNLLGRNVTDAAGVDSLLDPRHRFATRAWTIANGDAIRIDFALRKQGDTVERRVVFAGETESTDEIEPIEGSMRPPRAIPAFSGWGRGVQRLAPGASALVYCALWGDVGGVGVGCLDYGVTVTKNGRSLMPSWPSPAWSIYLEVE